MIYVKISLGFGGETGGMKPPLVLATGDTSQAKYFLILTGFIRLREVSSTRFNLSNPKCGFERTFVNFRR